MCGIAGFLGGPRQYWSGETLPILHKMADAIARRGPDGEGYWHDSAHGIALAHRRLSIVDLTPTGAQPMISASGRYVITFNGEIYNYKAIRGQLKADWRGTSDTETMLAGFEAWGLQETIDKAVGMFAFAVWDRASQSLTLARDRLGEKPLYYGWQGTGSVASGGATFVFGSDLAAMRAHPAFDADISRDALLDLLRNNNVGRDRSIYAGTAKLAAGCTLTVSLADRRPEPQRYWSCAKVAQRSILEPFVGGEDEAIAIVEHLLRESVSQQMVADVPVGLFLSGGVDSSLIAALMQAQASRPIKTFSIGFHESDFNEARYAKAVAEHIGADHTELYVTGDDAMAVVPQLAATYAEPFADSSQIPTFLLSKLARQHVTVALSGDGGDELFAGYNRYQVCGTIWKRLSCVPIPIRRRIAAFLLRRPPEFWDKAARGLRSVLPLLRQFSRVGDKVHKGARALTSRTGDELYARLTAHWGQPEDVVIGGVASGLVTSDVVSELRGLGDVERMMALDMLGYLCDDILTKVDRAAMASSLETRVPLLDHRVVEFAWRLPLAYKLRAGETKWILRQILYRHVPARLIERPKVGFAVPVGAWLRGSLRDWAEDLLSEARLKREGFFRPDPIRKIWAEHIYGARDWQRELWCVLMFQEWRQKIHG